MRERSSPPHINDRPHAGHRTEGSLMNDKQTRANESERREKRTIPSTPSEVKLDVEVLEERIAPALLRNRCETLVEGRRTDSAARSDDVRNADTDRKPATLDGEVREERIAPRVSMNRCETVVEVGRTDSAARSDGVRNTDTARKQATLDVEVLEERIAPLVSWNRCETLVEER